MLTATPSGAHGEVMPYLPSWPVTSPCRVRKVEVPCPVPFRYWYWTCCCVTPPSDQMLYGTHGGPLTQTGLALVPTTCRALSMAVKLWYLSLELKNVV